MMLLCVVAVFFVCNVLALVNNLVECFDIFLPIEMVELSNLLITINSSVNFVIYVIFGEKFKRLFLKVTLTPALVCLFVNQPQFQDNLYNINV